MRESKGDWRRGVENGSKSSSPSRKQMSQKKFGISTTRSLYDSDMRDANSVVSLNLVCRYVYIVVL